MNTADRKHGHWLKWLALGVAVLYALAFFWGAIPRYLSWKSAGQSVEWVVVDDPRALIALCFVLAVITLWQLEYIGELVASMLFFGVIARYLYWAASTWRIKTYAGLPEISGAGTIGNIWLGAGPADVLALVAAVIMLGASLRIVWGHRAHLTRQWHDALSPS
ncbi:MAG TPA: hypothetical protein VN282_01615 [Pyrinomonadaceae bacterium]|nr:hypothetical protein [Pyrinomonadaceae bacterium]